jgi:hypothetical protein
MTIKFGTDRDVPPYDAMVFQTNTHTIAVDSDGRRISSVLISKYTDDVVINAALTYLNGLAADISSGHTLRINSGTYMISAVIPIDYPHTINGAGSSKTILQARTAYLTDRMFNINDEDVHWYPTHVVMRDMQLHGNICCNYGITFGDIWTSVWETPDTLFENVTFTRFLKYGVVDNTNHGTTYRSCIFHANGNVTEDVDATTGSIIPEILTAYTALGATTNTTRVVMTNVQSSAAGLSQTNYAYDMWCLYNITRDLIAPISNYSIGAVQTTITHDTIAGQAQNDTFNIIPTYGGLWLNYCTGSVVESCAFRENGMGIFVYRAKAAQISNCYFWGNRYHGVYFYDLAADATHDVGNHIRGAYFYYNGAYVQTSAMVLYDVYIPNVITTRTTISDAYSKDDGYVEAMIYSLGASTTLLNCYATSGSIGTTLGGAGSLNINSITMSGGVGAPATVLAGNTTVTVTHGYGAAPSYITLVPGDDISGRNYWVSAVGGLTFVINISSADVVDHILYWSCG